jgi:toxin ParE1/3/4
MVDKPRFVLTRYAAKNIRAISQYSKENWSEVTAKSYIKDFYTEFAKIAQSPDRGKSLSYRSHPFLLCSVGSHFAVYDVVENSIVIVAVLHQQQDIETLIRDMTPRFLQDVTTVRQRWLKN